jgi:hypothetical protein
MNGAQLSEAIRRKAGEFRRLCDGIDEATASRAPSGRWSPKEIVSHLSGAEGGGFMTSVKAFLDEDTPEVELHPGQTQLSDRRARMSFAQLLEEFDKGYGALAEFVSGDMGACAQPADSDRRSVCRPGQPVRPYGLLSSAPSMSSIIRCCAGTRWPRSKSRESL